MWDCVLFYKFHSPTFYEGGDNYFLGAWFLWQNIKWKLNSWSNTLEYVWAKEWCEVEWTTITRYLFGVRFSFSWGLELGFQTHMPLLFFNPNEMFVSKVGKFVDQHYKKQENGQHTHALAKVKEDVSPTIVDACSLRCRQQHRKKCIEKTFVNVEYGPHRQMVIVDASLSMREGCRCKSNVDVSVARQNS